MISIRHANASDYAAISSIFHTAVHSLAADFYRSNELRAWAPRRFSSSYWRKRTAGLQVTVALISSSVAGFIGFTRVGYIDLLFTRPAFARRGVAKALLSNAESLLKWTAGIAWTDASLAAQAFFASQGYTLVREQKVSCWGVEVSNCRMIKALAPWSTLSEWKRFTRGGAGASAA
jgi:putative acetyltransferase